jgi:hypothetical protein
VREEEESGAGSKELVEEIDLEQKKRELPSLSGRGWGRVEP